MHVLGPRLQSLSLSDPALWPRKCNPCYWGRKRNHSIILYIFVHSHHDGVELEISLETRERARASEGNRDGESTNARVLGGDIMTTDALENGRDFVLNPYKPGCDNYYSRRTISPIFVPIPRDFYRQAAA